MTDQSLGDPWSLTDADVDQEFASRSVGDDEQYPSSDDFKMPAPESGSLPTFAEADPLLTVDESTQQPEPPPAARHRRPPAPRTAGEAMDREAAVSAPQPASQMRRRNQPRPSTTPHVNSPAASANDSTMVNDPEKGLSGWWRRLGRRMEGKDLPPEQVMKNLKKPLQGPAIIAVLNHCGGVGKSTVAAAIGQQMATHRRDRVVAVDAAVTVGGLSQRLPVTNESTIRTFLDNITSIRKWSDARQHTSQGRTGLELLTSGDSVADDALLTADGYRAVIQALAANDAYNLIIVDCDAGVNGPLMDAVFASADVLVVPMAGLGGVAGGVATMNRLMVLADTHSENRVHYQQLISNAVVVLNHIAPKSTLKDAEVETKFLKTIGVRTVVRVPFDPAMKDGAPLDIVQMSKSTRTAFLRLSAEIITSLRRSPS